MDSWKVIDTQPDFSNVDYSVRSGNGARVVQNGVANYTSDSSSTSYDAISFYCEPHSLIEVSFDAKIDDELSSGVVGIEGSGSRTIGGHLLDKLTIDSTIWKSYRFSHPVNIGINYCYVNFGQFTAYSGGVSIKNIRIKILNQSYQIPDIRSSVFRGTNGSWRINNENFPDNFKNHLVKSVSELGTSLLVNFEEVRSWQNPTIFLSLNDYSLGGTIELRWDKLDIDSVEIVARSRDGIIFDLSTFTGGIIFSLAVIGF